MKQSSLHSWIDRVNELQDPTYQYKVDIVNFEVRLFPLVAFKRVACVVFMKWEFVIADPDQFHTLLLFERDGDNEKESGFHVYDFRLPNSLIKSRVISPGHEGLFPGRSLSLHPLPDLPDRQSLF